MRNTVAQVFNTARAMLQGGDTSSNFGLSDTVMQQYFNVAYPEMWQIMAQIQTPRVNREFYYVLPANTTYFDPVAAGVTDFGEPSLMWERGSITQFAIATTSNTSPVSVVTTTPHGLSNNADVTVGEVIGSTAPWGRWFVTVVNPTTVTLNGSITDGNNGTQGQLVTSPESFDVNPVIALSCNTDRQPSSRLLDYFWQDNAFKFRGALNPVQILVTYWASAFPPANTGITLGIDDCMAFLSTRVASLAARSRGWYPMYDLLATDALGPKKEADASGGLLRAFLNTQVQGLQRTQFRKPPFRPNLTLGGYPGDYIYGSSRS